MHVGEHEEQGTDETADAARADDAARGYARDPARLDVLRNLNLLDTPREVAFDRVTELARAVFGVPIALVSLVDKDRQWFKSSHGIDDCETGLDRSFCMHAILSEQIFVVPDAARDPRFASNPAVVGDPFVRFYAAAPIRSREGHGLGTLCVIDRVPRQLDPERLLLLEAMAETVAEVIELRADAVALQRESERAAHLALLVERSVDAIYTTDPQGVITDWNPAAERLYGYSKDEVLGRPRRMIVPRERERDEAALLERVVNGERIDHYETKRRRKDGTTINVSLSLSQLTDLAGRVRGVCVIARDISERKTIEESLRIARDEAERANASKTEFLSRMSHELRTPLNAILGFAQLLSFTDLDPDHRESSEQIIKGGRHLLQLIDEVLDISRIESGQLGVSIEPVPLSTAVRSNVELIRPLAEERSITVAVEMTVRDDCHVIGDRQRLDQVLLNLLSNAVKYNVENGSVLVAVTAGMHDTVVITVHDSGPGISPEHMPRLFVPFDRLGAEQTSIEGTGLGLALAKKLVEVMGGRLSVESKRGTGTSFSVELRAADPPTVTAPAMSVLREPVPSSNKVLYIEDNLANRVLMEKILSSQRPGIQMMVAMTGELGLDLARQHQPELILLDLHLPDLEGEEVVARLRRDPRTASIPIVVLSADATSTRIKRLFASGVEEYVTKPIDVAVLMDVLDRVLTDATRSG